MDVKIEDSVELSGKYPSVVDRYFSRRFVLEDDKDDYCLLFHSNKICAVTIAKSHKIFRNNVAIKKVNFKVNNKVDRMENKVRGKGKKGGQLVEEKAVLCIVECEDGTEHHIRACVRGKLVEVNENLITNPQLLLEKPETDGYIAIILQKLGAQGKEDKSYVKQEDYDCME